MGTSWNATSIDIIRLFQDLLIFVFDFHIYFSVFLPFRREKKMFLGFIVFLCGFLGIIVFFVWVACGQYEDFGMTRCDLLTPLHLKNVQFKWSNEYHLLGNMLSFFFKILIGRDYYRLIYPHSEDDFLMISVSLGSFDSKQILVITFKMSLNLCPHRINLG